MVKAKNLWARRLTTLFFISLFLGVLLVSAALSVERTPFLPSGMHIHFFAALSFVSFLYVPSRFWPLLILPGIFLDHILQMPLGSHIVFMLLQYGCIFMMKSSLKNYGFFSHWVVFGISYSLIFTLLSPFSFLQSALTILFYPLILTWFLKFLFPFKQVSHG